MVVYYSSNAIKNNIFLLSLTSLSLFLSSLSLPFLFSFFPFFLTALPYTSLILSLPFLICFLPHQPYLLSQTFSFVN